MRKLARIIPLLLVAFQTNAQVLRVDTTRIAQDTPVAIETLKPVVTNLETFKKLITTQNYRQMGFESFEEASSAKVDPPIKDFMVRLDQLKEYEPGSKSNYLLTPTGQLLFPISVGGQVRSSMTMKRPVIGSIRGLSFGSPKLTKLITETIVNSSQQTGLKDTSYFIVRIPALNIVFLGYTRENEKFFIPLADDARFGFKIGESVPAGRVFTLILPEARAHDGSPR